MTGNLLSITSNTTYIQIISAYDLAKKISIPSFTNSKESEICLTTRTLCVPRIQLRLGTLTEIVNITYSLRKHKKLPCTDMSDKSMKAAKQREWGNFQVYLIHPENH
jgi:hypothetical protein